MASFIQFLQVNQHFKSMTPYGGIAPLGNSKWWFGQPDQDPKTYPQEVFIIDNDGNREILPQPVFTDGIGNFVIEKSEIATPVYPQIDKESYSIYVEVDVDGYNVIYERKRVKGETELSSNVQFKADLIDITDTKSTDDLEHNAATAESIITALSTTVNDLVRKTDLSDSIDSQSIDVAANSKAAYDLHELIKSSAFDKAQVELNKTNIETNTTSIATNVTNIATNTSGIATNTSAITSNAAAITSNTSAISSNSGNIARISNMSYLEMIRSVRNIGKITLVKTQAMVDAAITGCMLKTVFYCTEDLRVYVDIGKLSVSAYFDASNNLGGNAYKGLLSGFNIYTVRKRGGSELIGEATLNVLFKSSMGVGDSAEIDFTAINNGMVSIVHFIQYGEIT